MATILDGPMRKAAQTLLRTLGTEVTLRSVTAGNYDPTTGAGADTTADVTCRASLRNYRADELLGGVQGGDVEAIVAALDATTQPTPQDRVVIGSAVYEIVRVDQERSGDEVAYYRIQCRGPR